jgi:hypothetical protein
VLCVGCGLTDHEDGFQLVFAEKFLDVIGYGAHIY